MATTTTPRPRQPPGTLGSLLTETGDLVGFSGRAIISTGASGRYFAEILRQAGILVMGTTLIIVLMVMVVGGECGLFVVYQLRPIGATAFAGLATQLCGVREMWGYMFAYVFAAKVGCGLVAEIGSMRISEEIDALESIGIDPMRYVVATRLVAVIVTVPLMYAVAMVFGTLGSYLVVVVELKGTSLGQWISLHFSSQTLGDNFLSIAKVTIIATFIALVGMYYGYKARGGPVGVGAATARSMIVNLVMIHVVGAALTTIFWGHARTPIGG
ncbi:MAG TPA: ABC transporter permease [Solirubrobacteraceae bacterium]|jgi:phospholipid/cholesterol/gamma-HCH transport system permease protein|nr:ABC transporter permease [Solirubrobacteraceae bacterium]